MNLHSALSALILSVVLSSASTVNAQNLVPNPGFEVQDTCPAVSELFLAPPWDSPTLGTPDLFNSTCAAQNSLARTGIGSSGVFVFSSFANSREYLQAPLTAPLQAGQGYCVSFWVLRSNFQLAADRIGARFRTGPLDLTQTNPINEIPQVESPAGVLLTGTSWIQVIGQFTANGGEDHIIIGNFRDDANTNEQVVNPGSTSAVAYYRIDDISVSSCAVGIEEALSPEQITVFPQPASDLMHVVFPEAWPLTNLELLSLDGRVVLSQGVSGRSGNAVLDVAGIPQGVYILSLRTANDIAIRRVAVQR
jgi:hypothetical protein